MKTNEPNQQIQTPMPTAADATASTEPEKTHRKVVKGSLDEKKTEKKESGKETDPETPSSTKGKTNALVQKIKSGGNLWPIFFLIVGLAIAAALYFRPDGNTVSNPIKGTGAEENHRKVDPSAVERNIGEVKKAEESSEAPPVAKKVMKIDDFHTQYGGAVVRRIGPVRSFNGANWIPLYRDLDPKSKTVIMEPIDRSPAEVWGQTTLQKVKLPPGHLDIYDVVDTPDGPKNVLFWKLN